MKAEIIDDDGLWMIVDGNEKTAWAIVEEEIEPIRNACNAWLEKKSQEIMKETMEAI